VIDGEFESDFRLFGIERDPALEVLIVFRVAAFFRRLFRPRRDAFLAAMRFRMSPFRILHLSSVILCRLFNGLTKHQRCLAAACQHQVSTRRQNSAPSGVGVPCCKSPNSAAQQTRPACSLDAPTATLQHRDRPSRAPGWRARPVTIDHPPGPAWTIENTLFHTDNIWNSFPGARHDAIAGCLTNADPPKRICGPTLLDTGTVGIFISSANTVDLSGWPVPVLGCGRRPSTEFTFKRERRRAQH
jgi:hypothetical protein